MFKKLNLPVPKRSTFFNKVNNILHDPSITKENLGMKIEELYYSYLVLPRVCEDRFKVLYSASTGAPNLPIPHLVGFFMYARQQGLSEERMIGEIRTNPHVRRTLRIPLNQRHRIVSKSLNIFRNRLKGHEERTGVNLLKEELEYLNEEIAKFFEINHSNAREDSMQARNRGRIMSNQELVATVLEEAVRLSHGKDAPQEKSQDMEVILQKVAEYRDFLAKASPELISTPEFRNLDRVVREQMTQNEDGSYAVVTTKLPIYVSKGRQQPTIPFGKRYAGRATNTSYLSISIGSLLDI